MTMGLRWGNLLSGGSVLYRSVFAGPRDDAPLLFVEDRRRDVGRIWSFWVKGNF